MSYTALKAAIAQVIKANGNQEITGALLQNELFRIIDEMGAPQGYKGLAIPSTDPGEQDGNVFYFATQAGTYTNFDGVQIAASDGLYVISQINSVWSIERVLLLGSTDPTELAETIRKTLDPSSYVSYLPNASPFTTPSIPPATPTKVLVPTTIKSAKDFALVDRGGGNFAIQYQGDAARTFKVFFSTSMTTGANNVVFEMFMYRQDAPEPGIAIARKVGTGSDVGAIAVVGEFQADPLDFLEIYVQVDLASTVTFAKTSIIFTEKN